ncbi:unnamed protein product, partial [Scytosiphon promiscuus]
MHDIRWLRASEESRILASRYTNEAGFVKRFEDLWKSAGGGRWKGTLLEVARWEIIGGDRRRSRSGRSNVRARLPTDSGEPGGCRVYYGAPPG